MSIVCIIPTLSSTLSQSPSKIQKFQFRSADCFNSVCDPSSHTCRCGSSSDCKNGEECGSAFIPGVGLTFACGTPAGWYSAGDACALNPNLGIFFHLLMFNK